MTEAGPSALSTVLAQSPDVDARTPRDSPLKTLSVTLAICLACSLLVSIATVVLRPIQEENRRRARNAQLADILGARPELRNLIQDLTHGALAEQVVDLRRGAFVTDIDPAAFDPMVAAREPTTSRPIAPEKDVANIQRQAHHAVVTMVWQGRTPQAIVLPIYGRGYAAVIRGSIVLAGDGNTILGLVISEHNETPGIGSEIAEPEWTELWTGKKLRDAEGRLRLHVTLDEINPPDDDASFHVDGISGATRSSEAVGNIVRFWVGENGFGPLLARMRDGELR